MSVPIHIRIDEDLLKKVDEKAVSLGLTRSAFIKMILTREVSNGNTK